MLQSLWFFLLQKYPLCTFDVCENSMGRVETKRNEDGSRYKGSKDAKPDKPTKARKIQYDLTDKKTALLAIAESGWTPVVAARELEVDRSTIRYWIRTKNAILNEPSAPQKKRLKNNGKLSDAHEFEGKIVNFVCQQRELEDKVSRADILVFAAAIVPGFGDKANGAKYTWLNRFVNRHDLRSRIKPFFRPHPGVKGAEPSTFEATESPIDQAALLSELPARPSFTDEEDNAPAIVQVVPGVQHQVPPPVVICADPDPVVWCADPVVNMPGTDSLHVFKSDVDSLNPAKYVESGVIDFYIYTHISSSPACFNFNCRFFAAIWAVNMGYKGKQKIYNELSRLTSSFPWEQYRFLQIPVNLDAHYSIILVENPLETEPGLTKFIRIDSLHGYHNFDKIVDWLLDFFAGEKRKRTGSKHSRKCRRYQVDPEPRQKDSFNCGMYVLFFMERVNELLVSGGFSDISRAINPVLNINDQPQELNKLFGLRLHIQKELEQIEQS